MRIYVSLCTLFLAGTLATTAHAQLDPSMLMGLAGQGSPAATGGAAADPALMQAAMAVTMQLGTIAQQYKPYYAKAAGNANATAQVDASARESILRAFETAGIPRTQLAAAQQKSGTDIVSQLLMVMKAHAQ